MGNLILFKNKVLSFFKTPEEVEETKVNIDFPISIKKNENKLEPLTKELSDRLTQRNDSLS